MRTLALASFLALAACATAADKSSTSTDQVIAVVDIKCTSGSEVFEMSPGFGGAALEGKLTLAGGQTLWVCHQVEAPTDDVFATCTERPGQTIHAGKWNGKIHKGPSGYTAEIARDDGGPATMACTEPNAPAPTDPIPTYAEIAPLIESTCGMCHGTQFATLERVKTNKDLMIDLVSSGSMPQNDENWYKSDDGKKFLHFLQDSPELQ